MGYDAVPVMLENKPYTLNPKPWTLNPTSNAASCAGFPNFNTACSRGEQFGVQVLCVRLCVWVCVSVCVCMWRPVGSTGTPMCVYVCMCVCGEQFWVQALGCSCVYACTCVCVCILLLMSCMYPPHMRARACVCVCGEPCGVQALRCVCACVYVSMCVYTYMHVSSSSSYDQVVGSMVIASWALITNALVYSLLAVTVGLRSERSVSFLFLLLLIFICGYDWTQIRKIGIFLFIFIFMFIDFYWLLQLDSDPKGRYVYICV